MNDTTEAPRRTPRAEIVMGIVRWILLAGVIALAIWSVRHFEHESAAPVAQADRYYCPMHPQIRAAEPGECPICHMNLVEIPPERMGGASDAASDTGEDAAADATPVAVSSVTLSPDRQALAGIVTVPAVERDVAPTFTTPAVIEAPENGAAEVHVRANGFLERVDVRETGVRVSRGQTLAWFYSPQIYQAEQELLTASHWNPAAGAPPSDSIARAARTNLTLLGLEDADIDALLRRGTPTRDIPVRATASGYVSRRTALPGAYVTPETSLYDIADLAHVWIVASVYARDLPRIHRGMHASYTSRTATTPVVGRVELIEPDFDLASRTARARLVVDNPGLALRPGEIGTVAFETETVRAVLVPRDAVVATGREEYVYVATAADRFDPRRVETGELFGDEMQIVSGLRAGERVVTRGNFMLDSESRLETSLREAPPPASMSAAPSDENGPACATAFDRTRYPDRYTQCLACERVHAGMGRMVADCKNAIPRPWR